MNLSPKVNRLQRTIASLCLLTLPITAFAARKQDAAAPTGDGQTTAFVHASVVPMNTNNLLVDQTVVVRGDRIVSVGPASKVKVPADARVIDATGQFLLPGLVDPHAHPASQSDLSNYIASGITTVVDADNSAEEVQRIGKITAGTSLRPTIHVSGDAKFASAGGSTATLQQQLEQQVHSGRTPFQALQSVTVSPARNLSGSREFGTVTTGSRADLVLLSGNPLQDITNTQRIAGVMVRGHWLAQADLQLIHVGEITRPSHARQVTYVNGDGSMKYVVSTI
ncbi:MAG TPA: amidohydrolase family protein [Acidobacteriaceae bacterium]